MLHFREIEFFSLVNFDNRKRANVFCILLFAGMRAKVDSEQNITSAILRPSLSPAQLIPRDERLAEANQRPARGPGDQSEAPLSPSLARPNPTRLAGTEVVLTLIVVQAINDIGTYASPLSSATLQDK